MEATSIQQAFERACAALEAGQVERAWQELAPLAPEIDRDPAAAAAWLDMLRMTPARATLIDEARRILARFPEDAALVTRACDALIRAAERLPPDEPPPEHGAARVAADAAGACLAALDRRDDADELRGYLLVSRGNALRLLRDVRRSAHRARSRAGAGIRTRCVVVQPRLAAQGATCVSRGTGREPARARVARRRTRRAVEHRDLRDGGGRGRCCGRGAARDRPRRQARAERHAVRRGLPPMQVRAATVGSGLGSGSQCRTVGRLRAAVGDADQPVPRCGVERLVPRRFDRLRRRRAVGRVPVGVARTKASPCRASRCSR